MIRIYGITYGDKTTEYTEFRNDKPICPWRWENGPMMTISDTLLDDLKEDDIVGVVSWKFSRKTFTTKPLVMQLMADVHPRFDVFSFSRYLGDHIHFMNWSDQGHAGIIDYVRRCCEHCGMVYNNDADPYFYANQFLARKWVYQEYINTVIKPCLELLEGPMWDEVNRDAGYTQAMKQPALKEKTGLDFYNYVPFVLERMMAQYVFNRKLRVMQMI